MTMASPGLGFSWRGSLSTSRGNQSSSTATIGALSPPLANLQSLNVPRGQATSATSAAVHREPIRSFISGSARDRPALVNTAEYARSVREDSAELASYFLSDKKGPVILDRTGSQPSTVRRDALRLDEDDSERNVLEDIILEVPESPHSPSQDDGDSYYEHEGRSMLSDMLRGSPPDPYLDRPVTTKETRGDTWLLKTQPRGPTDDTSCLLGRPDEAISSEEDPTEDTALLGSKSHASSHHRQHGNGAVDPDDVDTEGQKRWGSRRWLSERADGLRSWVSLAANPTSAGNGKAIAKAVAVELLKALPAVFVGLILNILDALSYGMILFPLGDPIFANLGPAGISIFYVSTIVSQLVFSTGSIFKGGVGSELIEVVPFFHNMASTITSKVGRENPDAVIATTIFCFSFSSLITGAVFFTMGALKFGYLVGFIPRHILIGCIGGVGFFLVQTGLEVTSRLEGSFRYDLSTLSMMFRTDTVPLWTIPLGLAVVLFVLTTSSKLKDNHYVLPVFICLQPAIFWFFVTVLDSLHPEPLREKGWILETPQDGESWWYFYTLFNLKLIAWDAVAECIPAMLALTFFGVLHVPINVPALALQTGEDHANLDRELKLHGLSNFLSGCAGSIQNYLVYANSQFFIKSGGNSRLAGYLLALFTGIILGIGPVIIGFIPVMMVGTLIFVLGFELLLDALWDPRKKLNWLEYMTVISIVLVMGTYDFVVGIGVGVLLAFVSLIFQSSRVSAIRATYSGEVVTSTVRRNPSQQRYLHMVGDQIRLIKLAGFLFFGTIVSVEEKIRQTIADDEFQRRPIRFLILDLRQVSGLDYSAGEAFSTVSRLLAVKKIVLVLSGVDMDQPLGRDLRAVGLGSSSKDTEVTFCANLNSALEKCENEQLRAFYANQEAVRATSRSTSRSATSLDVPAAKKHLDPEERDLSTNAATIDTSSLSLLASSPRRSYLHQAAREALTQREVARLSRWQNIKEPLRLMLQIFHDLSDKNKDFWIRAKDVFRRNEFRQGEILFRAGEPASGFYLVESGILRAEYDLPQGWLYESIVAGTTCGELPFFSETARTATVSAERDSVVWRMDRNQWDALQKREPDVARELLRISLKLTSERMDSITSYVLTMAG